MSISSRFSGHVSLQARHASFAHAILFSASFIVSGIASSCCALGTFPFTPRSNHRGQNSSTRPQACNNPAVRSSRIAKRLEMAEIYRYALAATDQRDQALRFPGVLLGPFQSPGKPRQQNPRIRSPAPQEHPSPKRISGSFGQLGVQSRSMQRKALPVTRPKRR